MLHTYWFCNNYFGLFLKPLKCPYGQQGICVFGISITTNTVFRPKNINFDAFFAIKSRFKFPALDRPNEVDCRCNKRLVTHDVTSVTSQCFMLLFILLP